jgi:asparagine synthase (glutamine-hydrolysing)
VLTRRKQGFGVPVKRWLRRELYGPVAEAFAGRALAGCPWLDPRGLQAMLDAHRDGAGDHSHPLWSLYVFARWLERVAAPAAGAPAAAPPVLEPASRAG